MDAHAGGVRDRKADKKEARRRRGGVSLLEEGVSGGIRGGEADTEVAGAGWGTEKSGVPRSRGVGPSSVSSATGLSHRGVDGCGAEGTCGGRGEGPGAGEK